MTEQQIDRERLRAGAEQAVEMYGPAAWPDVRSADLLALLDQLDQAEARTDRWRDYGRTQRHRADDQENRAIRAVANLDAARARAEIAEARIQAVRDVHTGAVWPGVADKPICDTCDRPWPCPTIRALDGDA